MKIIAKNKRAYYDYRILDKFEAGIVLSGSEIKSIRQGRVSLKGSYVKIIEEEIFLIGTYISPYQKANIDPVRTRKLLLNKGEIKKLIGKTKTKGYSLIPLKLYLKKNLAKLEIALVKGKKKYDRRDKIKKREEEREIRRELKY